MPRLCCCGCGDVFFEAFALPERCATGEDDGTRSAHEEADVDQRLRVPAVAVTTTGASVVTANIAIGIDTSVTVTEIVPGSRCSGLHSSHAQLPEHDEAGSEALGCAGEDEEGDGG